MLLYSRLTSSSLLGSRGQSSAIQVCCRGCALIDRGAKTALVYRKLSISSINEEGSIAFVLLSCTIARIQSSLN